MAIARAGVDSRRGGGGADWLARHGFKLAFLLPAALIYAVFLLVPIVDSMRMSFYGGSGLIPDRFVGISNYVTIFTDRSFSERVFGALQNTVVFFLEVTLVQNLLGFFVAFILTRNLKGSGFFRKLSFLPTTISVLVVGFVFRQLLNPMWGLFGSYPWLGNESTALATLSLAVSWQFIGESILFYAMGIDGIPPELLEAARIDGASWWQEVRHVIVPGILPIIGIVSLLIFIGDFTQFDIVYAMTTTSGNPAYKTDLLGSLFYRAAFASPVRGGWGLGMGAAVSTIICLVVSLGVAAWLYFFRIRTKERG